MKLTKEKLRSCFTKDNMFRDGIWYIDYCYYSTSTLWAIGHRVLNENNLDKFIDEFTEEGVNLKTLEFLKQVKSFVFHEGNDER